MGFWKTLKTFINKHKHGVVLLYGIVYLVWFTYLELTITATSKYNLVYSRLDDLVPFMEIFILPYYIWFLYIAATIIYFLLTSKSEFFKCCAFLFIGMTACLVIYTIWPNGQNLRPDLDTLGRSNIFIDLLSKIYLIDTPTNVFPSVHVYNSIGAMIAIHKNAKLRKIKWLQISVAILTVLISLSTVFLKQHSVNDIFGAIALSIVVYFIVYVPVWERVFKPAKQELSKASQGNL